MAKPTMGDGVNATLIWTCQQPQPKKCGFFLWADEAQIREEAALFTNKSREPATPPKPIQGTGLATPDTGSDRRQRESFQLGAVQTSSRGAPVVAAPILQTESPHDKDAEKRETQASVATNATRFSDDEFFDWPISDDEELGQAADQVSRLQSSLHGEAALPETPRKVQKKDLFSTPVSQKRRYDEVEVPGARYSRTLGATPRGDPDDASVFEASDATFRPRSRMLRETFAASDTPTPTRFKDAPASPTTKAMNSVSDPANLAIELFSTLSSHHLELTPSASDAVKSICDRHAVHAIGLGRGRDIMRDIVKSKEETILRLRGEIETLRSQLDTKGNVIEHLKRELETVKSTGGNVKR